MYRIAVCEDNDADRAATKAALGKFMSEQNLQYAVTDFWSGEEFVFHNKPYMFDLVLFDVKMRRISGIDAAKKLRETDRSVVIIFLTTYTDFVFSSFEAEPIRYLIKPLIYEHFREAMVKAIEKADENCRSCYCMTFGGAAFRLPLKEIQYFSSEGRTVQVHCASGQYSFYAKLDEVEADELLGEFLRCHQSILVNPDFIRRITKESVTLFSGEQLPVSRVRAKEIKDEFFQRIANLKI